VIPIRAVPFARRPGVTVSVRGKGGDQVDESVLPPGQRDRSGFWLPQGHENPSSLVRRRRSRAAVDARRQEPESGGEVSAT
jgi:hypothetical protein